MDDDEPDRQAAVAAVREGTEVEAAARERRREEQELARAAVEARARAAGWTINRAAVAFAWVVAAGILAYTLVALVWAYGRPTLLLFVAPWVPSVALILLDHRRGPRVTFHTDRTADNRWVAIGVSAFLGALTGLAASAIVGAVQNASHSCQPVEFGDCGFAVAFVALMIGPPAAVVITGLILLACRIRHSFFIALLGVVISSALAGIGFVVWSHWSAHVVPVLAAVGAAGFALAGAAHTRAFSPVTRTTVVAIAFLAVCVAASYRTGLR